MQLQMTTGGDHTGPGATAQGTEEGQGPAAVLAVLWTWRRFIVLNCLAVAALAAGVSLLLPVWYRASASLLPPREQSLSNLFGSPTSLLRGLAAVPRPGGLTGNTGAYNYFAILKSRSAMESVVKKFNLIGVYGISDSSTEKALRELKANTVFEYQDDDYITIEVEDKDPRRAASMANYFVDLLNEMSIRLGTQEARSNREFIGNRIDESREVLHAAEESLKTYQEKSGIIITPEQSASVSSIAELYAMKVKKEVEVGILERTATPDNEALQQARLELREFERKLSGLPKTGIESLRLYRAVATQQKILEVLLPLFEQARINEQKDIPVLLVLDKAVPPERKVKPQRLLIVFVMTVLILFLSVLAVLIMHAGAARMGGSSGEPRAGRVQKVAKLYRVRLPA